MHFAAYKPNKQTDILLTEYHSDDQIKKNEMGEACSTYRGDEMCVQNLSGEA